MLFCRCDFITLQRHNIATLRRFWRRWCDDDGFVDADSVVQESVQRLATETAGAPGT
jgi:hypothetical protein